MEQCYCWQLLRSTMLPVIWPVYSRATVAGNTQLHNYMFVYLSYTRQHCFWQQLTAAKLLCTYIAQLCCVQLLQAVCCLNGLNITDASGEMIPLSLLSGCSVHWVEGRLPSTWAVCCGGGSLCLCPWSQQTGSQLPAGFGRVWSGVCPHYRWAPQARGTTTWTERGTNTV